MTTTMTPPTQSSPAKPVAPPAVPASSANTATNGASPLSGLTRYLKEVLAEGKKVSWPTGPQIVAQTIVVLFTVTVVTLSLWGVDNLFHLAITLMVPHRG
jgi:preprotein translocase SecE subunit